jgi:aryl-alcohol dehydrogenase-like predicted oxidoreductase
VIPTLPFGRTGHESTRIIFGAAALLESNDAQAAQTLELLLEHGVNHIDAAAAYGDAELWVGRWMAEHRDRFFLASKTRERSYAAARDEIRRSLERLRCDRIDLIQMHNLVKEPEWEEALGDDGALRACVEAREEGLVRFIGVTGHGTRVAGMHLRSLERFAFDSVLLPYNFLQMAQPGQAAAFDELASTCSQRGVAVQTIKSIARRRWPDGSSPRTTTWYEPLESEDDVNHAVAWALSRPGIFVNTASDVGLLERMLAAALRWAEAGGSATDDAQMREKVGALEMQPLFVPGYQAARTD